VAAVVQLVLAALLHLVLIVTGDIVRVGAAAAAAVLAWRWRKRKTGAARTMPPLRQKMARAASPLPQTRRPDATPSETARELPGGLHLPSHGVTAEDVTEVLRSCGASCGKPRATLTRPNDAKGEDHPAAGTGPGLRPGPGQARPQTLIPGEERDATPAHPAARRVYRAFS
jgi:hypothetical protein